ncbi:hypothetical protein F5Y04DRAFT_253590 [Hypomontagnella monticulosa]|nr:hypothetical protein F5Y04DRAFT_253590 [Hypomontagnella monticulosa]
MLLIQDQANPGTKTSVHTSLFLDPTHHLTSYTHLGERSSSSSSRHFIRRCSTESSWGLAGVLHISISTQASNHLNIYRNLDSPCAVVSVKTRAILLALLRARGLARRVQDRCRGDVDAGEKFFESFHDFSVLLLLLVVIVVAVLGLLVLLLFTVDGSCVRCGATAVTGPYVPGHDIEQRNQADLARVLAVTVRPGLWSLGWLLIDLVVVTHCAFFLVK